ncbi:NADPH-dependent FMN reductase [Actinomadura rupiterrae]|uniref:NADPH-dependent FMN reductase n=1 Tax=Actinomadura rupiterrae TaxID=559627 RepID=UPI0027E37DEF|nr:NAD(P)H-dependent oxidoreductase [Actinomadura rupiterrae]MCP2335463.1 NAD(P)H-dependent FMN reductase [Actinomadura rupiterrae]
MLKVAVIIGSTREGRLGGTVGAWIERHLQKRDDMEVDVVDLAATPLPTVLPELGQPLSDPDALARLAAVSPRLAAADAFVVVTPEYNRSFPASLKNAIDWHNKEWHAKPIGFVSYGGFSAGTRAVEQLRLVFAELHAVTIRDGVGFNGVWGAFGPDGEPPTRPPMPPPRRCSTSSPGGPRRSARPARAPPTRHERRI